MASLERQMTPRSDYEIVPVDGGSTDKTQDLLESHRPAGPFRPIYQGSNKGIGAARNDGIAAAAGDILLFIDGDMEAVPGWVESHLASYEHDKCIGVTGQVRYPLGDGDPFVRYLNRPRRGAKKYAAGDEVRRREFLFWNASMRKKVLTAVGGFDEQIKSWGGEEMELAYKVKKLNRGVLTYNPQAVTYHHSNRGLSETCAKLQAFGEQVVPYLVKKHPELREELGVPLVEAAGKGHEPFHLIAKRQLVRIGLTAAFFRTAERLYQHLPGPLAFPLIKYLLGASVLIGYRQALRQGGVKGR